MYSVYTVVYSEHYVHCIQFLCMPWLRQYHCQSCVNISVGCVSTFVSVVCQHLCQYLCHVCVNISVSRVSILVSVVCQHLCQYLCHVCVSVGFVSDNICAYLTNFHLILIKPFIDLSLCYQIYVIHDLHT